MSADERAAKVARSMSSQDLREAAEDGEIFSEIREDITSALLDDGRWESVPASDLSDIARDALWEEITRRGITFA